MQSPLTSVNQKMKGVPFRNNPPPTHTHRDQARVCFVTTSVTVPVLNIHVQGLTLPPSKAPGQTRLLFGGWIWGDCNRARGWSIQMLNPGYQSLEPRFPPAAASALVPLLLSLQGQAWMTGTAALFLFSACFLFGEKNPNSGSVWREPKGSKLSKHDPWYFLS